MVPAEPRLNFRWERRTRTGVDEAYNGESVAVFVVYCPPPGQSSGPRRIAKIEPGGFVGNSASMKNVLGPYLTRPEAERAADDDRNSNW